ncbi:hypothetical protein C444_08235 [Haloarcula japonica DSM 6131]|nr:hypothetical protein C444_08235 [Haloarcula japonica DSM 6131]
MIGLVIFTQSHAALADMFEDAGITASNRMGDSHGQMACYSPFSVAKVATGSSPGLSERLIESYENAEQGPEPIEAWSESR